MQLVCIIHACVTGQSCGYLPDYKFVFTALYCCVLVHRLESGLGMWSDFRRCGLRDAAISWNSPRSFTQQCTFILRLWMLACPAFPLPRSEIHEVSSMEDVGRARHSFRVRPHDMFLYYSLVSLSFMIFPRTPSIFSNPVFT